MATKKDQSAPFSNARSGRLSLRWTAMADLGRADLFFVSLEKLEASTGAQGSPSNHNQTIIPFRNWSWRRESPWRRGWEVLSNRLCCSFYWCSSLGKCLEEHNQPRMTNSTPRKRYQPGHHKLPHLSRWYNDRLQQPWQRMENIKKKPPTRLNGSESTPRNHQTRKIRIFSSVEFEHLKSSWTKMLRYVRDLYILGWFNTHCH